MMMMMMKKKRAERFPGTFGVDQGFVLVKKGTTHMLVSKQPSRKSEPSTGAGVSNVPCGFSSLYGVRLPLACFTVN